MNSLVDYLSTESIQAQVRQALEEDVGNGDQTARLIAFSRHASAFLIVREPAVLCGIDWFEMVFRLLDPHVACEWLAKEGEVLDAGMIVARLDGPAQALLTGERTALNFLQTLSAVATRTRQYVLALEGLSTQVVDTRKTIPGLRLAEKYAVRVGGGTNHRLGLYDAILIKENHIQASETLQDVIRRALRTATPGMMVQVEVETLTQLAEAIHAGAKWILLDNMTREQHFEAVKLTGGRASLEISGGVTLETVRQLAESGVDRISIGSLTKDIKAIDYSLRFQIDE